MIKWRDMRMAAERETSFEHLDGAVFPFPRSPERQDIIDGSLRLVVNRAFKEINTALIHSQPAEEVEQLFADWGRTLIDWWGSKIELLNHPSAFTSQENGRFVQSVRLEGTGASFILSHRAAPFGKIITLRHSMTREMDQFRFDILDTGRVSTTRPPLMTINTGADRREPPAQNYWTVEFQPHNHGYSILRITRTKGHASGQRQKIEIVSRDIVVAPPIIRI